MNAQRSATILAQGTMWSPGRKDWSKMTNLWRWLARRITRRAVPADEFRAERMGGGWQPEYLELAGRTYQTPSQVTGLFYRLAPPAPHASRGSCH